MQGLLMLNHHSSLQQHPSAVLVRMIEDTEREIHQQEATIASLTAEGHVVTDAVRHLNDLLHTLAALVRTKMNLN
jgi:hypothetical protein